METVVERDVVALGDLRRRAVLPQLVEWIAASTGTELNMQAASSRLGIDRATLASYLAWMETVFLVHRLPAWSRSPAARTVRRPKVHMTDTGLAASLLGLDARALTIPTAPANRTRCWRPSSPTRSPGPSRRRPGACACTTTGTIRDTRSTS